MRDRWPAILKLVRANYGSYDGRISFLETLAGSLFAQTFICFVNLQVGAV